jgi:hypothetical protein
MWGEMRFTTFLTPKPVDIELPEAVLGFTKKNTGQASLHHLLGPFWPQNHKLLRDFFDMRDLKMLLQRVCSI